MQSCVKLGCSGVQTSRALLFEVWQSSALLAWPAVWLVPQILDTAIADIARVTLMQQEQLVSWILHQLAQPPRSESKHVTYHQSVQHHWSVGAQVLLALGSKH